MPLLPMVPQVFSILSGLVADRSGLHFDTTHAEIFGDKVSARAAEAGFDSLLDYYYFLRYDAAGSDELDRLIEGLVVSETYLFRELQPLETAVDHLIVPKLSSRTRPRIWCAACATGEEPHTLAMLLASRGILGDVDFVASDISNLALDRARSGRFGPRALRGDTPPFAEKWLERRERGVAIDGHITKAIDWRRINLVDRAAVAALGTFDVVICRNVLIYFNDQTVRQVVESLAARLRPGGALLVGVSESLIRLGTSLRCEEQSGVFLYKKAA